MERSPPTRSPEAESFLTLLEEAIDGLPNRDVGPLAGVSHVTIGRWRRGETCPTGAQVQLLASALLGRDVDRQNALNDAGDKWRTARGEPTGHEGPAGERQRIWEELREAVGSPSVPARIASTVRFPNIPGAELDRRRKACGWAAGIEGHDPTPWLNAYAAHMYAGPQEGIACRVRRVDANVVIVEIENAWGYKAIELPHPIVKTFARADLSILLDLDDTEIRVPEGSTTKLYTARRSSEFGPIAVVRTLALPTPDGSVLYKQVEPLDILSGEGSTE